MKPPTMLRPQVLLPLLALSLSWNVWTWLRPEPSPSTTAESTIRRVNTQIAAPPPAPSQRQGDEDQSEDEQESGENADKTHTAARKPEQMTEDELIFGNQDFKQGWPIQSAPRGKVSSERLRELADAPPSGAAHFLVKARLQLPGDRWMDFGTLDIRRGQRAKLERIKEFPYPTSYQTPQPATPPGNDSSYPVIPVTPLEFETKNYGVEIELDVEPLGGLLIVGGKVSHSRFDGFGQMPGEAFAPIYAPATDSDGRSTEVLLTDNKVLQPRFTTGESPFVAAAASGTVCLIPVQLAFGQTFLEVTCTPGE